MATEGPAKLKHGKTKAHDYDAETDTAPSVDRWVAHVKEEYGDSDEATLKRAYAEIIVKEYADRYGAKIDGWWFDHAAFGDMNLLREVCREANPECVLTFNKGTLPSCSNENPGYEDYVCGHPNPCRLVPPSDEANLQMVEAAERSRGGFVYADDRDGASRPSLCHLFMPMCKMWCVGDTVVWTEERAVEWMSRVLNAGGAWTWNVPLDDDRSMLHENAVEFAVKVGLRLLEAQSERKTRAKE